MAKLQLRRGNAEQQSEIPVDSTPVRKSTELPKLMRLSGLVFNFISMFVGNSY